MQNALSRILACLLLLGGTVSTIHADLDVAQQASALIGTLNPVNLALGPLVDNAISSGNFALAQRLEQLRAIIQESLYTLDQIAQKRITQVNADAEGRIKQLQDAVNQNQLLFNSILSKNIEKVDDVSYKRIQQLGDTTGNLIQALPIPASPLPDVPGTGFAVVRETGEYTSIFITGVGLYKGKTKPDAYLVAGNQKDSLFSFAGTKLNVSSYSMGLLEIQIPKAEFPKEGPIEKTLHLHLRSNPLLPFYDDPTFPIVLCSSLPQYVGEVTQTASGQFWERQRVPYPSPVGRPDGVYITDNGSNSNATVCATDFGGWSVDPEAAESGLEVNQSTINWDKDGSRVYKNTPRPGCYYLYAGRDGNEGGHAQIGGVFVHQRRLKDGQCGDASSYPGVPLSYGSDGTIPTTPQKVLGQCVSTTAGASVSPRLQTIFVLKDVKGNVLGKKNLVENVPTTFLDGDLTVTIDSFGLIQVSLDSKCRRKARNFASK
jgi:hypothetical protein